MMIKKKFNINKPKADLSQLNTINDDNHPSINSNEQQQDENNHIYGFEKVMLIM